LYIRENYSFVKNIFLLLLCLSSGLVFGQHMSTFEPIKTQKVSRLVRSLDVIGLPPQQQADRMFEWVIHRIRWDMKAYLGYKYRPFSPHYVLRRKKTVSDGYAQLYIAMLREVGIEAEIVEGYQQPYPLYEDLPLSNHGAYWVVYRVDNRWVMANPMRGAGYAVPKNSRFYDWIRARLQLPPRLARAKFVHDPNMKWGNLPPLDALPSQLAMVHFWQLAADTLPFPLFEAGYEPSANYLDRPGISTNYAFKKDVERYLTLNKALKAYELGIEAQQINKRNWYAKGLGLNIYAEERLITTSYLTDSLRQAPLDDVQQVLKASGKALQEASKIRQEDHRDFAQQMREHNRSRETELSLLQQAHQRHQRAEARISKWQVRQINTLAGIRNRDLRQAKAIRRRGLPRRPKKDPVITPRRAEQIAKQWSQIQHIDTSLSALEETIISNWELSLDTVQSNMNPALVAWKDSSIRRQIELKELQDWFSLSLGNSLPNILQPWVPFRKRIQEWQQQKQQFQDSLLQAYQLSQKEALALNREYLLLTRKKLGTLAQLYRSSGEYETVASEWVATKNSYYSYLNELGALQQAHRKYLKSWKRSHKKLQKTWRKERKILTKTETLARKLAQASAQIESWRDQHLQILIKRQQKIRSLLLKQVAEQRKPDKA